MIEVKNLTKRYGAKIAVDNINFTVEDGEILGFLGPNGAGKSTTMNILTGYISSTEGQAFINGIDILEDPIKAKKFIGYLPENPPLYMDMTVKDYLNFIYQIKKVKMPKKAHIEEVCKLARISDVYNRIIKNLSKGYRQRVGIAQALIGNPPILILDEPTVGLDPKQIIEIRTLIKKLGKRHTVILSSHILSEIQSTCDRVIIINNGVIAADGKMNEITQNGGNHITARIEGTRDEVLRVIKAIPDAVSVTAEIEAEPGAYDYEIICKDDSDIRRELIKRIDSRKWTILGLKTDEITLEDVFLKITMGGDTVFTDKPKLTEKEAKERRENIESSAEAALTAMRSLNSLSESDLPEIKSEKSEKSDDTEISNEEEKSE
ncbi:MAG: ABC transporter ATP-binding protein [Ruminococcus sp.]|nr:ABC transporter ATP-binding protein [Ruminococcus sp.]